MAQSVIHEVCMTHMIDQILKKNLRAIPVLNECTNGRVLYSVVHNSSNFHLYAHTWPNSAKENKAPTMSVPYTRCSSLLLIILMWS